MSSTLYATVSPLAQDVTPRNLFPSEEDSTLSSAVAPLVQTPVMKRKLDDVSDEDSTISSPVGPRVMRTKEEIKALYKRLEEEEEAILFIDRMEENVENMLNLGAVVVMEEYDDEVKQAEVDFVDEDTVEIFGGYLVEGHEKWIPPPVVEKMWIRIHASTIEEWWQERYTPVYNQMCSRLDHWRTEMKE